MALVYVSGGSGRLMVEADECRLRNGDAAFPPEFVPRTTPPLPDWFSQPVGSAARKSVDLRPVVIPLVTEVRNSRDAVEEVLSFYDGCTARGGLVRSPEPSVGRAAPGFIAEDSDYSFSIDLHRHRDLTSWTIQLVDKTMRPRRRVHSLLLLDRDDQRAILQDQDTGEEYVAPAGALTEIDPQQISRRNSEPRQTETILWSSLPMWIQFGFGDGREGEVHRQRGAGGVETWDASIFLEIDEDDHRGVFESCLNTLDACGFDATGAGRPDRSYYVSICQWGHSLSAHVKSDSGDNGSVSVINTPGNLSVFARYSPPRR